MKPSESLRLQRRALARGTGTTTEAVDVMTTYVAAAIVKLARTVTCEPSGPGDWSDMALACHGPRNPRAFAIVEATARRLGTETPAEQEARRLALPGAAIDNGRLGRPTF